MMTDVSPTRYLSDLNVPLDMETLCPVDVAQRPWNWTIGAAGWAAPAATANACHVCLRPRRVRGACKVLDLRSQALEEKSAQQRRTECRWMTHQTACPEARPNTIRHQWENFPVPCGESKEEIPDSPLYRKQAPEVQLDANEHPGGHRENDDAKRC